MAALKQDSSESESEDGNTTYRSLAGTRGHETSYLSNYLPIYAPVCFDFRVKQVVLSLVASLSAQQTRAVIIIQSRGNQISSFHSSAEQSCIWLGADRATDEYAVNRFGNRHLNIRYFKISLKSNP